ncbi:MAG TPA: hypothetical protein VLA89_16110, partial [Gemmatimonadales bacterium]|nr:hypothetical protein [Gemmatimonadales bacterium]
HVGCLEIRSLPLAAPFSQHQPLTMEAAREIDAHVAQRCKSDRTIRDGRTKRFYRCSRPEGHEGDHGNAEAAWENYEWERCMKAQPPATPAAPQVEGVDDEPDGKAGFLAGAERRRLREEAARKGKKR